MGGGGGGGESGKFIHDIKSTSITDDCGKSITTFKQFQTKQKH